MIAAMNPLPTQNLHDAIAWLAAPVLAAAAFRDIAVRRIPNAFAVAVAALGLVHQALAGLAALGLALLAAGIVALLAGLLWQRGLLGGGDVKLLGAVALLLPAIEVPVLLLAVAIAGGVLAGLHLALRPLLLGRTTPPRPAGAARRALRCEAWRIGRGAPLPYGVAIGAGAVFMMFRQGG